MSKKKKSIKERLIIYAIIVGVILALLYFSGTFDSKITKKTKSLEEEGYEVLRFYCSEDSYLSNSLEMKSFGGRYNQAQSGMWGLYFACENDNDYVITIKEETKDCFYFLDGNLIHAYFSEMGDEEYEINETEIIDTIMFRLWESFVLEEMKKEFSPEYDIEVYKSINEKGFSGLVLRNIVNYYLENEEYCE